MGSVCAGPSCWQSVALLLDSAKAQRGTEIRAAGHQGQAERWGQGSDPRSAPARGHHCSHTWRTRVGARRGPGPPPLMRPLGHWGPQRRRLWWLRGSLPLDSVPCPRGTGPGVTDAPRLPRLGERGRASRAPWRVWQLCRLSDADSSAPSGSAAGNKGRVSAFP